jgi:hypothetical protein
LSKYKSCSLKSKYCKANVFSPNYVCIIAEEQDILLETSLRKLAADNSDYHQQQENLGHAGNVNGL